MKKTENTPLPIVNVFQQTYEAWSTRSATFEEMRKDAEEGRRPALHAKNELQARVSNPLEAAVHIASVCADGALSSFINTALDSDAGFKSWRSRMPGKTPEALTRYQQKYPHYDQAQVDSAINDFAATLTEGQCLFHGGSWPADAGDSFETDKPLSTSFCPQVALRNAEHKGKAYEANKVELFVLRATNPATRVFSYRRAGTKMGNENEVVFASGSRLTLRSRTKVRSDYGVSKVDRPDKEVEIHVLEVDIS